MMAWGRKKVGSRLLLLLLRAWNIAEVVITLLLSARSGQHLGGSRRLLFLVFDRAGIPIGTILDTATSHNANVAVMPYDLIIVGLIEGLLGGCVFEVKRVQSFHIIVKDVCIVPYLAYLKVATRLIQASSESAASYGASIRIINTSKSVLVI